MVVMTACWELGSHSLEADEYEYYSAGKTRCTVIRRSSSCTHLLRYTLVNGVQHAMPLSTQLAYSQLFKLNGFIFLMHEEIETLLINLEREHFLVSYRARKPSSNSTAINCCQHHKHRQKLCEALPFSDRKPGLGFMVLALCSSGSARSWVARYSSTVATDLTAWGHAAAMGPTSSQANQQQITMPAGESTRTGNFGIGGGTRRGGAGWGLTETAIT